MRLRLRDYYNVWYVNSNQVDNIVIFDKTGALLEVSRGWLESVKPASPSGYRHYVQIESIDELTEVVNRRKVDFNRQEHFLINTKGTHTLYLNAGLFGGYSTVSEVPSHDSACSVSMVYEMQIYMSVNGEPADWVTIRASYTHRSVDKPNAEMVRAVMALYNSDVADHPNRHIGEEAALRLVSILPKLAKLAASPSKTLEQPVIEAYLIRRKDDWNNRGVRLHIDSSCYDVRTETLELMTVEQHNRIMDSL